MVLLWVFIIHYIHTSRRIIQCILWYLIIFFYSIVTKLSKIPLAHRWYSLKFVKMNVMDFFGTAMHSCISPKEIENDEDPRINQLRKISYGFIMPIICFLGIIGNILNLIVLTRRNMQGTAYIYMRGEFDICSITSQSISNI